MNAASNAVPINRPTIRAASFHEAVALAGQNPDCLVEVFVTDWSEVDRRRGETASLGLAGRITIHHRAALDALIHLKVFPGSDQEPPTPGPTASATTNLVQNFLQAFSALCRTRFTVILHRKAFS